MRMRMISSGLAAMLLASCATVETGPPLADGAMLPSGDAAVLRMPAAEPAPAEEEPPDRLVCSDLVEHLFTAAAAVKRRRS